MQRGYKWFFSPLHFMADLEPCLCRPSCMPIVSITQWLRWLHSLTQIILVDATRRIEPSQNLRANYCNGVAELLGLWTSWQVCFCVVLLYKLNMYYSAQTKHRRLVVLCAPSWAVFTITILDSLIVTQIASLPAIVFHCIQYLEAKRPIWRRTFIGWAEVVHISRVEEIGSMLVRIYTLVAQCHFLVLFFFWRGWHWPTCFWRVLGSACHCRRTKELPLLITYKYFDWDLSIHESANLHSSSCSCRSPMMCDMCGNSEI